MKKIVSYFLFFAIHLSVNAQSFNQDRIAFVNFVKRMYNSTPFEGVKIVDDYDHHYLISVVSLEKAKYANESIMTRVSQVKSQSQVNTFLNGSTISMDLVIKTTDTRDSSGKQYSVTESMESIKQNSIGFSQGLELLTNFEGLDAGRVVFIYFRDMKN